MLLVVTAQMAGCSTTNNNVGSTEYEQMEGLDSVISAELNMGNTVGEADSVLDAEAREATGNEETEVRNVTKTADVFSKPKKEASAIGKVSRGDTIRVIDLLEDGNWYKVVYKGRVAYIASDAVEADEEDEDTTSQEETTGTNTDTNSNNNTNGNTNTNNSTPSGGGNSENQNHSGQEDNKKPDTTNPEESTNSGGSTDSGGTTNQGDSTEAGGSTDSGDSTNSGDSTDSEGSDETGGTPEIDIEEHRYQSEPGIVKTEGWNGKDES